VPPGSLSGSYRGQLGKHMLAVRLTPLDPKQPFSIVQNRNLHRPETPAIFGLTALFDPQALRDAGIGEEGFPAREL